jgi:hypothetical protein
MSEYTVVKIDPTNYEEHQHIMELTRNSELPLFTDCSSESTSAGICTFIIISEKEADHSQTIEQYSTSTFACVYMNATD